MTLETNDVSLDPTTSEATASDAAGADTAGDSTDSPVQWDSLADEFVQGDAGEVEGDLEVVETQKAAEDSPAPAAAAPTQVAPTAPAATPSPAAPTTPAVAAAPVAPQPAPASPVAQTPPQGAPTSPEAPAASAAPFDYNKWRTDQLTALTGEYKLSDDDATAMLTEPEVVLPRIAAELHLRVMESAMTAVQRMLPSMLHSYQQVNDSEQKAKNLFTTVNPDLADPQYEQAIFQFGQTYRAVNKNASPEEASRAIGNLVRAAYGLQAPGQTPAGSPPASMGSAPAPAAAPFVPVRGGGGQGVPSGAPQNPFEQLALDFLKED